MGWGIVKNISKRIRRWSATKNPAGQTAGSEPNDGQI
jgi:hypothetical protein